MTRHPAYSPSKFSIVILESNAIASASSGKGGGLIARWAEPECLAKAGFDLHQELSDVYNGSQKWGYRRVTCADCTMDSTRTKRMEESKSPRDSLLSSAPSSLDWVRAESILSYNTVGTERDTAQCTPYLFTRAMCQEACAAGVQISYGMAIRLRKQSTTGPGLIVDYVEQATSDSNVLLADEVVVAAGPWSCKILSEASVSGARCHSIVLRPKRPLSSNLLFTNITYGSQNELKQLTPEIYPRPDGTVYACEAADPTVPMPVSSAVSVARLESCDVILAAVSSISERLQEAEYETKQVCYQPIVVLDGKRCKLVGPFVSRASLPGVYLACGHDSWGISNAPSTGKALSELILDGKSVSVEIDSLARDAVMARAREMKH